MFSRYPKYPMPEVEPVPIDLRGLPWWKRWPKAFKRRQWRTTGDYVLYIQCLDKVGLVPKGFVFDFASVPRIFWPIISPTGPLLAGSVFHDFGYRYGGLLLGDLIIDKYAFHLMDRRRVDAIFKDITSQVTGANTAARTGYTAVRIGGFGAWRKNRKASCVISEDFKNHALIHYGVNYDFQKK